MQIVNKVNGVAAERLSAVMPDHASIRLLQNKSQPLNADGAFERKLIQDLDQYSKTFQFATLWTYHFQATDEVQGGRHKGMGQTQCKTDVRLTASDDGLMDMRVSSLFAEAVLTEWLHVRIGVRLSILASWNTCVPQVGTWCKGQGWGVACTHCCLADQIKDVPSSFRMTHQEYRERQNAYHSVSLCAPTCRPLSRCTYRPD